MATWPAKINYATGDVLTAAQMNDIGGELNDLYNATGGVGRNPILNSGFNVWQRGTSVSVASNSYSYYTADRWALTTGSVNPNAHTVSRQATNDTTNLPNIQYCTRVQRNSGQTSTSGSTLATYFETANSVPFAGKTVTWSFYARKGADYSPTSGQLSFILYTGTGTDQNPITGSYTGQTIFTNYVNLTSTWVRYSATIAIPANTTEISLTYVAPNTGTAGTNDYYELTGVQLDVGSVALPYKPNSATYQGELAACQRYYYRATAAQNFSQVSSLGTAASTTACLVIPTIKVTLRATPTVVDYSGLALSPDNANSYVNVNSATISVASPDNPQISLGVASGLTQYRPYYAIAPTAGGYLGIGAEL